MAAELNNYTQSNKYLNVVSYNMHGFNQGFSTIRDLCLQNKPDIFIIQEHWLTPDNISRFERIFPDYFSFGSSAMINTIESGLLKGRPFGGVLVLLKKELQKFTRTLFSSDRCVIVKIFNYLLINVYLPCAGTVDRLLIIEEILNDICNYLDDYPGCIHLIGGDFNCDLDGHSEAAELINSVAADCCLNRCDRRLDGANINRPTYVNLALNCSSCLDYFLVSNINKIVKFDVIDEGSNLSDHLPISLVLSCECSDDASNKSNQSNNSHQAFLRWDYADLISYNLLTGQGLQSLLNEFDSFQKVDHVSARDCDVAFIEHVYNNIVNILSESAKRCVPVRSKQFYKFWWDQELDCLKDDHLTDYGKLLASQDRGLYLTNFAHASWRIRDEFASVRDARRLLILTTYMKH